METWTWEAIKAALPRELITPALADNVFSAEEDWRRLRARVAELENFIETAGTIEVAAINNSVRDYVNYAIRDRERIERMEGLLRRCQPAVECSVDICRQSVQATASWEDRGEKLVLARARLDYWALMQKELEAALRGEEV